MKINRTYIFIAVTSIALLVVLIIQVDWIMQTARVKEELFNEKVNMVLSRTAEDLSRDKETFKQLKIPVGKNEVHKIDSLFAKYMKFYNIHINYSFEVKQVPNTIQNTKSYTYHPAQQQRCYSKCMEVDSAKNSLELKLVFPPKEQFIVAEMGTMFITSVILILLVLIISTRTMLSLWKEKKISEHTTDFLNNMTHEFKTPLTNISLAGKMMIKDTNIRQEDKIKHYSGIILDENEKLRLQVEQVLSMTALERGEIPLQKTELDFHQLIHDALKYITIQIENKDGYVALNLNAHRVVVMGDKTHLTNALCNIIDNAIKYSHEKPEISIQTSNDSGNIVITIADKGIGIKKEYQKKVFDKFFIIPTGNVHDVKGFGLGLAYVKRIVELHSGAISLNSDAGKGTTFTITLPNV
jgi:two-component system phosphate regulon sensor histidine kinase PhoR